MLRLLYRSLFVLVPVLLIGSARADEAITNRGKAIFAKQCAKCHGKTGQGVPKRYEKPLSGNVSLRQLEELIADTMPEDNPDACIGADAKVVARYIHEAFYGKSAELPRIRLARLTGNQLRHSVADLYGRFMNLAKYTDQGGIHGEYYDANRPRKDKRKIERVDASINFDFQDKGPSQGEYADTGIKANEFAIQWSGGLKVDVTGTYEIIVRCSCSFVFDLGNFSRRFIDNHVQSGDKTEFRRSIVLTAGRVYPFRLMMYQRKRKTKQPPAWINVSWVPPHGTEQIIPKRNFRSNFNPPAFSLQTKLPPDDRSYGYERGIAVDRQWDDSTTAAAIEFAQIAIDELWPRFRQMNKGPNDNRQQLRRFLEEITVTAFRGPIDDVMRNLYVNGPIQACEDDADAIKRSVLMTLKSPRFLYPLLDHDRSPSQKVANRLALTLYDSLPAQQWLRGQARENHFDRESRIRVAATRMVADYRTRGKTREMLYAWLNLSHFDEITKDAERFPDFDKQLVGDMRASLDAFLDDVVWSDASDFRQLMTADWAYTNERLQKFYGAAWKPIDSTQGLQKTGKLPHRRGLLAHPYLMTGLAYADSTSPIHRGVFVIRYLLGRTLRPPQEAFTPLSPKLHPDLTTRERISLQTSPKSCQVCHTKINALGFTLENFDAVGRYRVKEKGRAVNTLGGYTDRSGKRTKIEGPDALSSYLATSDDAHRAFVERAFQHFVKQPPSAYGSDTLDKLIKKFKDQQFNIRNLIVDIAVVAASGPIENK
ncbi:MAG: hypothetical protein CMJ78_14900 [Planctomycetaceae bacterium]|nr:hypothetical protein [Planctomycetaceae bacterium]